MMFQAASTMSLAGLVGVVLLVVLSLSATDVEAATTGPHRCQPDLSPGIDLLPNPDMIKAALAGLSFTSKSLCQPLSPPALSYAIEERFSDPGIQRRIKLHCASTREPSFQGCLICFSLQASQTAQRASHCITILTISQTTQYWTVYSNNSLPWYKSLFPRNFISMYSQSELYIQFFSLPLRNDDQRNVGVESALTLMSCRDLNCTPTFCQTEVCCITLDQPPSPTIRDELVSPSAVRVYVSINGVFRYPRCTDIVLLVRVNGSKLNTASLEQLQATDSNGRRAQHLKDYYYAFPYTQGDSFMTISNLPNGSYVWFMVEVGVKFDEKICSKDCASNSLAAKEKRSDNIFCINAPIKTLAIRQEGNCSCTTLTRTDRVIGYNCSFHPDSYPSMQQFPTWVTNCSASQILQCPQEPASSSEMTPSTSIAIAASLAVLAVVFIASTFCIVKRRDGTKLDIRTACTLPFEFEIGGTIVSAVLFHANARKYPDHRSKIETVLDDLRPWMTDNLQEERRRRGKATDMNLELIVYVLSQEFVGTLRDMNVVRYSVGDEAWPDHEPLMQFLMERRRKPDLRYIIMAVVLGGDRDSTTPMELPEAELYVPLDTVGLIHLAYDRGNTEENGEELKKIKEYLVNVEPFQSAETDQLLSSLFTSFTYSPGQHRVTLFHASKLQYPDHYVELQRFVDDVLPRRIASTSDSAHGQQKVQLKGVELMLVDATQELLQDYQEVYESEHPMDGNPGNMPLGYIQDVMGRYRLRRELVALQFAIHLAEDELNDSLADFADPAQADKVHVHRLDRPSFLRTFHGIPLVRIDGLEWEEGVDRLVREIQAAILAEEAQQETNPAPRHDGRNGDVPVPSDAPPATAGPVPNGIVLQSGRAGQQSNGFLPPAVALPVVPLQTLHTAL